MPNYAADTLKTDTAMLNAWRESDDYDYAREMVQSDFSLSEWLAERIDRMLGNMFGGGFYEDHRTLIWTATAIVFIAIAALFVYRKRPALFGRDGKAATDYDVTEDTIYGIDFEAATDEAMRRNDYREAVRLAYLHCLKLLADNGHIVWQPWKTPAQYATEMRSASFDALSAHFMRVRYGNFAATEELALEMRRLTAETMAGKATAQQHGNNDNNDDGSGKGGGR